VNRRIDLMTWPEIRHHLDAGRDTIVLAFGATEQHGPHLLLADTLLGDQLAAHGVHTISSNGVIGDLRSADRERGERYWAYITTTILDVLGGTASD
jgi:creatinine amidohydrolase/Fe(II)-dependent formamide hydrolase-like protein